MQDVTTVSMESKDLANRCAEICEDRKAENVVLYDVRGASILADFYLICTANSDPHMRAVVGRLNRDLAEEEIRPNHVEGQPASRWVIIDYGSVIVHVLDSERRGFYDLEDLWGEDRIIYRSNGNGEDEP